MFGKSKQDDAPAQTGYAWCETVHASALSVHHIRKLTDAGLKLGGGADTETLCARDLGGGWDTSPVRPDDDVLALSEPRATNDMRDASWRACRPCAVAYLVDTGQ